MKLRIFFIFFPEENSLKYFNFTHNKFLLYFQKGKFKRRVKDNLNGFISNIQLMIHRSVILSLYTSAFLHFLLF